MYITELQHGPVADTICVKVMRKWTFDGNQHGVGTSYIGLVLADEMGDYIYAQISEKHMDKKGPLLELDNTYLIKKFNVKTSKRMYVPFVKQFMIEFSAFTTVAIVRQPPKGFPEYVYRLTPYSELNPIYPDSTVYVDVLGIVTSVGELQNQRLSSVQKVVAMREVIIKNERDEELKITLWAEHATNFSLPDTSTSENKQSNVILFVGCVPKSMNRVTQVNGSYGCRWFFNPNIVEAEPLYESLKKNPIPVCQPPPPDPAKMQSIVPIELQHQTLEWLNNKDPYEFAREGYKCTVTITGIHQDQKYWYIGCAKCKTAFKEDTGTFYCTPCKCSNSRPFYKLNFTAEDETAEGQFFAYDVAARNIVHRDVKAVLNQQAKESGFPRFLKETVAKKYTLHITLRDDSYDEIDHKTYFVKAVLAQHDLPIRRIETHIQVQPPVTTEVLSGLPLLNAQTPQRLIGTAPKTSNQSMTYVLTTTDTPPPAVETQDTPSKDALISTNVNQSKNIDRVKRSLFPEHSASTNEQLQETITIGVGCHEGTSAQTSTEKEIQMPCAAPVAEIENRLISGKKTVAQAPKKQNLKRSIHEDSTKQSTAKTPNLALQKNI